MCFPCIARESRLKKECHFKEEEISSLQRKMERCEQVQTGEGDELAGVRTKLAEVQENAAQLQTELEQARQQIQQKENDFEARLEQLCAEREQERHEREGRLEKEMQRLKSELAQQCHQREREVEEGKGVANENGRLRVEFGQQQQRWGDSEEALEKEVQELKPKLAAAAERRECSERDGGSAASSAPAHIAGKASTSQNAGNSIITGTGLTALTS
jgi:chromosome segregation ATPase